MDEMGPPGAELTFDAFGLFSDDLGRQVWNDLCLQLEQDVDQAGWDQPAHLHAVVNPVHTQAGLGFDPAALLNEQPDAVSVAMSVSDLGEVPGHPVETLWGASAPAWASAVALTFEGWLSELPPGARSARRRTARRKEMRTTLMVTRAGALYHVTRVRGEPPHATAAVPQGFLPDVLARLLGVDLNAKVEPTADILAAWTVNLSAGALQQLCAELTTAGASPPEGALGALSRRVAFAAAANVVWTGTDGGRGLGPADANVVQEMAVGAPAEPAAAAVAALARAGAVAAAADVPTWAAGTLSARLVPAPLGPHASWAGPALASRWLLHRMLGPAGEQLQELSEGAVSRQVGQVLTELGWGCAPPR